MKSRTLIAITLTLLGLLAIVALFYKLNNTKSSNLLSKELVCEFPCWQQITPQETTFDEALLKMREMNLVEFSDQTEIEFKINDVSGSVSESSDGKVGFIILYVKNQEARLRDVVQIIGDPEKMLIGREIYLSDYCYVYLLFPKNGTVVELHLQNRGGNQSCRVNIVSEIRIFRIVLLGHDPYNNPYWNKRPIEDSEYIKWNGYGTYSK